MPAPRVRRVRRVPHASVVGYDMSLFANFNGNAGRNATINSTSTGSTITATVVTFVNTTVNTTTTTTTAEPATPAPEHEETRLPNPEVYMEDPRPSLYDLLMELLLHLAFVEIRIFEIFEYIGDDYAIVHQRQIDVVVAIARLSTADTLQIGVTEVISDTLIFSDGSIYKDHYLCIWVLAKENQRLRKFKEQLEATVRKAYGRIANLVARESEILKLEAKVAALTNMFANDSVKIAEMERTIAELSTKGSNDLPKTAEPETEIAEPDKGGNGPAKKRNRKAKSKNKPPRESDN